MSVDRASWHALDFAAAVLGADVAGREMALAAMLERPVESFHALGVLLLGLAGPEAPGQLAHMLAMTSLAELEAP